MARAVRIGNSLCQEISGGGNEQEKEKEGRKEEEEITLGRGEKKVAQKETVHRQSIYSWEIFPLDPPTFFSLFLPALFLGLSCFLCQSIFYNCRFTAMNPSASPLTHTPRSVNDR